MFALGLALRVVEVLLHLVAELVHVLLAGRLEVVELLLEVIKLALEAVLLINSVNVALDLRVDLRHHVLDKGISHTCCNPRHQLLGELLGQLPDTLLVLLKSLFQLHDVVLLQVEFNLRGVSDCCYCVLELLVLLIETELKLHHLLIL